MASEPVPVRLSMLIGFTSLLVVIAMLSVAGWFVLGWFSTLQREVATAIIAGFVAVMVSIVSVLLSKYFDRKREIEQAQRAAEELIGIQFVAVRIDEDDRLRFHSPSLRDEIAR